MNILHINTYANIGGAARAMYRLHQELKRHGHNSRILAGFRTSAEPDVFKVAEIGEGRRSSLGCLIDALGRRVEAHLGIPYVRYRSTSNIPRSDLFEQTDIVNLHNLHGRYFDYHLLPSFSALKPMVWTLHDMWPLTGHCAYSYDCQRWKTGCFDCSLLREPGRRIVQPPPTRIDRTRQAWRTKRRLYQKANLHIVTPSHWLCRLVQESILAGAASTQCIPYGVDLTVFRPLDRAMSRRALDIPLGASTILFVAHTVSHGRKGFGYLLAALERIPDAESIILLTVGAKGAASRQLDRFKRRDLGTLSDERLMSLAYNAADVFVLPTLADNQPLVLIESMACGTPMVCFDVGGVPEMVRHMETGYLARYKDAEDLARGIQTLLGDDDLREQMSRRCRGIAETEYALGVQARRYVELYEHAIESRFRQRAHSEGRSSCAVQS